SGNAHPAITGECLKGVKSAVKVAATSYASDNPVNRDNPRPQVVLPFDHVLFQQIVIGYKLITSPAYATDDPTPPPFDDCEVKVRLYTPLNDIWLHHFQPPIPFLILKLTK